jgi:hypothetical protein
VRAVEIYKHLVVVGGTDLNAAETPPNETTPSSSTADASTIYSWNRKKSAVTRNESKSPEQATAAEMVSFVEGILRILRVECTARALCKKQYHVVHIPSPLPITTTVVIL